MPIEGNDNLGKYKNIGVNVYAVNGWKDVDINYSGAYLQHGGTLHCGKYYNRSCNIASNGWYCVNEPDGFCHDNQPMIDPTTYPTHAPTAMPSSSPTIVTTSTPAMLPSPQPTLYSSISPTISVIDDRISTLDLRTTLSSIHSTEGKEEESYLDAESVHSTVMIMIIVLCILCVINTFAVCYCKLSNNKMKAELMRFKIEHQDAIYLDDSECLEEDEVEGESVLNLVECPGNVEGSNTQQPILNPDSELLYISVPPKHTKIIRRYIESESDSDMYSPSTQLDVCTNDDSVLNSCRSSSTCTSIH